MLLIISSENRGCCSSTVPIHEPPLMGAIFHAWANETLVELKQWFRGERAVAPEQIPNFLEADLAIVDM